ncbi:MAG: hypothetical protein QOC99_3494 [Acidobacteriota bacterium]|jgi:hypothetical protein|nr:hypothetical protein [Acidobacteriota bacterium]
MSSSEQDRIRELAERVARRLSDTPKPSGASDSGGGELVALRASLSEIQRRLAHIESHITNGEDCEHDRPARPQSNTDAEPRQSSPASAQGISTSVQSSNASEPTQTRSTWLSGTYVPATSHPSQEQFNGLGEAVSELVEFFEREKTCTVEPGGKSCDHCGLCSARGF